MKMSRRLIAILPVLALFMACASPDPDMDRGSSGADDATSAASSNGVSVTSANQAGTFPTGTLVDMSYAYGEDTIYWPTAPGFVKTTDFEGMTEGGYYYTAYTVTTAEHGGTHLDAPIHFAEGRNTADEIPLDRLMGSALVVDISERALEDRDYRVSVADVEAWESEHGPVPDGSILLFHTGYGRFWPDAAQYMGTAERGPDAVAKLRFPGLHPDLATFLVAERDIKAVGIDTPSIDYGQSTGFEAHRILFEANIPAFENVANLDQLPATGAHVIALPMKIAGGSGGPLRMVGIVP